MALETAHIFLVEPSDAATETPGHRNLVKPPRTNMLDIQLKRTLW